MENDIARIELATAHRALASYNLNEGVNNHMTSKAISRFDETKEIILMLPFGKQWSDARPDDFLEIDSGTVSDLHARLARCQLHEPISKLVTENSSQVKTQN